MQFLKAIILSAFLFSAFAFSEKDQPDFIGTYGISKNYPVKYELKINADHTFTYQDFTNPNNKIEARGIWELKNDKLLLQEKSEAFPYGTKWKIEKDGKAVRTRKGLEFIRLAKL
ncbi:hypothetical protein [Adhaeribacter terreus]|uniref:Uncharacterized protein n=1 Tax=Adhaeribacter terreus TaxID=529703 RepID=A0ABW0EFR7_9BACT